MKEFIINTISDLDEAVSKISRSALCRGVSDVNHSLIPSLFRHHDIANISAREKSLMWVFKTQAKPLVNNLPETDLEWLVIAQHHGLPTRLLDWSLSPLVACFFAVHSLNEKDGAIYIYDRSDFHREEKIDVDNLKGIKAFLPSHASQRVSAQSGMFTIHPNEKYTLDGEDIKKLIIPNKEKRKLLDRLVKFGIHHGTMFPDLDGLSNYIKYLNHYKNA